MNDELRRHDGEADVPNEDPTTCAVTMADDGRPSELSGAPIGVPRHHTTPVQARYADWCSPQRRTTSEDGTTAPTTCQTKS